MISEETVRRCVGAVLNAVLEPALVELENEAGQRICVDVRVARPVNTSRISRGQCESPTATGEIRIALKESLAGKIGFSCQAVIRGLSPSTGFSGFSMEGRVDLAPGGDKIRLKGRTNHYNQWEWRPEFMMA